MSAVGASGRSQSWTARVLDNKPVCREHLRLSLSVSDFPPADAGQFIHLRPHNRPAGPEGQAENGGAGVDPPRPFLARAFSIGGLRRTSGVCEIDVIYRVVGAATRWMSGLRSGDAVDGIGPLGRALTLPPETSTACLVAGGVGLPPLLLFARQLRAAGRQAVLFLGARSGDLLPLNVARRDGQLIAAELPDTPVVLATDDGSVGFCGTVVEAFQAYVADEKPDERGVTVYACGPEVMMGAVARYCAARSWPCYVCLERAMACGIGTCQSCVVPVKDVSDPEGWRYALCCSEGPVFEAGEVLWDGPMG